MAAAPRQNLFNLTTFLTKRDAWAGNLEELLLDAPRTVRPRRRPLAPPCAQPPRGRVHSLHAAC